MRFLLTPSLFLLGLALLLTTSCTSARSTTQSELIRIGWGRADNERFAYLITPNTNNSCEIAIVVNGKILEKTALDRTFPELLKLAKTANEEIVRRKDQKQGSETEEVRRLAITYGATSDQSFSLKRNLADMLRVFEESKALHELLLFASRDQPKNYRILDEPGPHKAIGNE